MSNKPTLLTRKFIDKLEVKASKYRVFEEGEKDVIGALGISVYPSGTKSYVEAKMRLARLSDKTATGKPASTSA